MAPFFDGVADFIEILLDGLPIRTANRFVPTDTRRSGTPSRTVGETPPGASGVSRGDAPDAHGAGSERGEGGPHGATCNKYFSG